MIASSVTQLIFEKKILLKVWIAILVASLLMGFIIHVFTRKLEPLLYEQDAKKTRNDSHTTSQSKFFRVMKSDVKIFWERLFSSLTFELKLMM